MSAESISLQPHRRSPKVVFKMNRAHSLLEVSLGEGDLTLNASKTTNFITVRGERANATTRGLIDKKRGLRGVACSEARLLGPYLRACNGNITKQEFGDNAEDSGRPSKVPKRVNTTHVHLFRARSGTVGTDEHGAGTKTLRSLGPRAARDAEEFVGSDCAPNVERNQTEKTKNVFRSWALLQVADELRVRWVRWYQSWARHPKDDHAVVTPVLGTCKARRIFRSPTTDKRGKRMSDQVLRWQDKMADDLLARCCS